jgi:hypothetical protein
MFFSRNNILQHGLYWNIGKQTRLCLGTFEDTEADREIDVYSEWITKSKNIPQHFMWEFLIILHIVSLSVDFCLSLYVMLRSARHRTSQKKTIMYITWKVLWGPFDRIVGSIWPQAEININKK